MIYLKYTNNLFQQLTNLYELKSLILKVHKCKSINYRKTTVYAECVSSRKLNKIHDLINKLNYNNNHI